MRPAALVSALVALAAVTFRTAPAASDDRSIISSVVDLAVVQDQPDLRSPWQTEGPDRGGGSGVIIEGRRILTNAHVVEAAVRIEVKRADRPGRFPARVVFISHDADLALLEVDDGAFFRGAEPVPIGPMPKLQQEVQVYGFPIGGRTLSVTSGIVSRIEVDTYLQSNRALLNVQIDAAINSGNSGGPVISKGAIVGIAKESSTEAENTGYMAPPPVIQHFLRDVADGRYDGFPTLGIKVQDMESEAQRRGAGMTDEDTGALVLRVDYGGPAYGVLRPRDVLLAIDGHAIANDMTVAWNGVGRVDYDVTYQSKQVGESISLTILRDRKKLQKRIELTPHRPLVPGRRSTEWPRYLQIGGLVFQPLTYEVLDDPDWVYADSDYYADALDVVTKERREIIILGSVLPHPVNRGYESFGGEAIRMVNGIVPRDLEHLASLLDRAKGPWLRVVVSHGDLITLDLAAVRRADAEIVDYYGLGEGRYLGPGTSKSKGGRRR